MTARAIVRISRDSRIIHSESVYGDDVYTVMHCEVADLCRFFEEDGDCHSVIEVYEDNEVHSWIRYYSDEYGFYVAKHLGRKR